MISTACPLVAQSLSTGALAHLPNIPPLPESVMFQYHSILTSKQQESADATQQHSTGKLASDSGRSTNNIPSWNSLQPELA